MTLRRQLRNSLESVSRPHNRILFSRLWTVPSGLVSRVSCFIASSLSIIINLFCSPCQGLLFFYSSCFLRQYNGFCTYCILDFINWVLRIWSLILFLFKLSLFCLYPFPVNTQLLQINLCSFHCSLLKNFPQIFS